MKLWLGTPLLLVWGILAWVEAVIRALLTLFAEMLGSSDEEKSNEEHSQNVDEDDQDGGESNAENIKEAAQQKMRDEEEGDPDLVLGA